MKRRFYLIFTFGIATLAAAVWFLINHLEAHQEHGKVEFNDKKDAREIGPSFPKLTSKMTELLPTYNEPIDDFPPNWEEGYGDFSDKGMLRVWREMGAGELPDYVQPIKGYHKSRMDTRLLAQTM
jgi:hypothetical protein